LVARRVVRREIVRDAIGAIVCFPPFPCSPFPLYRTKSQLIYMTS
jgi:hypothetical protein